MAFFDKKEDVIKLELTEYGKHLLSLGKLKPKYYSFFDDDILYDSEAGGFTETQTMIKTRILEETPKSKPYYNYMGIETQFFKQDRHLSSEKILYPTVNEKLNFLQNPLGTADPTITKTPAWEVVTIRGEISGVVPTLSASTYQTLHIPQVDCDINYFLSIKNNFDRQPEVGMTVSPNIPRSEIKQDGTFLNIEEEQLLVHIEEKYCLNLNDSLEIEVYMFDDADSSNMIPLKFRKREEQIKNGFLVNMPPLTEEEISEMGLDETQYVEYYFDLRVDKEIPEEDICQGVNFLKTKQIYLDMDFECPERQGPSFNIYQTDVDPEDCV